MATTIEVRNTMAKQAKEKTHPLGLSKIGNKVWKITANRQKIGMVVMDGDKYCGWADLQGISLKTWATTQGHLLELLWSQFIAGRTAKAAENGPLTLQQMNSIRLQGMLDMRAYYKKNYHHVPMEKPVSKQKRRKARQWARKNNATVKSGWQKLMG